MNVLRQFKRIWQDPPPAHAFEISPAGIAWSRRVKRNHSFGFEPLEPDVLSVSPLADNVVRPDEFFSAVKALSLPNGKSRKRPAALVLPDYCSRIVVLDFDNFPSDKNEQGSLVRFRLKKSTPFDLDSATLSYHVQPGAGSKKHEVVAAVAALEIIARYEAAFRSAGFEPGQVTTSTLSALSLLPTGGLKVLAKLNGEALSVAVVDDNHLRMLRCVELPEITPVEIFRVLIPTFAYVEDEFKASPETLFLCAFGALTEQIAQHAELKLGVPVDAPKSRFGDPGETNAGLLGFLEGTDA